MVQNDHIRIAVVVDVEFKIIHTTRNEQHKIFFGKGGGGGGVYNGYRSIYCSYI